jgi:hypothetical protein
MMHRPTSDQPPGDRPAEGSHRFQTFTLELQAGSGDSIVGSIGLAGDQTTARIPFNGWLSFIAAVNTVRRGTGLDAR